MQLLYTGYLGDLYVTDTGTLIKKQHCYCNYKYKPDKLCEIFYECGNRGTDYDRQYHTALNFVGKPLEDLKQEIKRRALINEKIREKRQKQIDDWNSQENKIKQFLIGIDKKVYDFETGFNVYVLTNTKHTKKEQIDFVKNHKKLFINFVVKEIKKIRKGKYSDLLPFCYISEITVKNNNEIVVTFEIKEELQEKLQLLN
ncbi:MAG: hypothetical protein K2J73_08565 [Oscillospiraceae bacterium]|nr:hypothetical protein [Oscillospiraceae bacterium]